jgi:hypothetical protein
VRSLIIFAFGHRRPHIGAGKVIRGHETDADNKTSVLLIGEFTAMKPGGLFLA